MVGWQDNIIIWNFKSMHNFINTIGGNLKSNAKII